MKVEKYYDYFGWNIVNVGKLFSLIFTQNISKNVEMAFDLFDNSD